jgi:hypothetical protein
MEPISRWVWRRWQLICVDEGVLDVVDVTDSQIGAPVLLAVQLEVTEGSQVSADGLATTLRRWAHDDDGVCDVFLDGPTPGGLIALVHGSHLLIAAVSAP